MPEFTVFRGGPDGVKRGTTVKPDELSGDRVLKHRDIVLGHEGVGVVEAVGPDAAGLRRGDRVGWGYETNSCGRCLDCLSADEIYCRRREVYGGPGADYDQGSFASHAVLREAFLHRIPAGLGDADAAPLQCAGATVFSALQGVGVGATVGVVGVGGLGHMAIQFAAKMGCRVVALSSSGRKREDALELGAHRFVVTGGKDGDGAGAGDAGGQGNGNGNGNDGPEDEWPISRLLVTTSALPDWRAVMPLLGTRAVVYVLTASRDDVRVPCLPLLSKGISVRGMLTASRGEHRRMLDFAALHGIRPLVERFPMSEAGIREAIERLESGRIRFRAVLIPQ
ncbi:putative formaldehyde dehydrogenase [Escovopsis weberi]|uniref:Putative formaldehyde dehydrogenase n=1 Tax=Escovopsis weberi TaxID=150374 RepID=A0A0M8N2Q6_ESCWE|nr:putative formaldehyde dehydrogenase [Escovopsis weberi]